MDKKSNNHSRAPLSSAFVNSMREAFGDVKVLYVKEGELELGEPCDQGVELASANALDVERAPVLAKKRVA